MTLSRVPAVPPLLGTPTVTESNNLWLLSSNTCFFACYSAVCNCNSPEQFVPFALGADCVRALRTVALGKRRPKARPARSGSGDPSVKQSAVM